MESNVLVDSEQISNLISAIDREIMFELVSLFQSTTLEIFTNLEDVISKNDWPNIKREAHSLKGSAGNIGARYIKENALQIEKAAMAENMQDIIVHFANIKNHFNETIKELEITIKNCKQ